MAKPNLRVAIMSYDPNLRIKQVWYGNEKMKWAKYVKDYQLKNNKWMILKGKIREKKEKKWSQNEVRVICTKKKGKNKTDEKWEK